MKGTPRIFKVERQSGRSTRREAPDRNGRTRSHSRSRVPAWAPWCVPLCHANASIPAQDCAALCSQVSATDERTWAAHDQGFSNVSITGSSQSLLSSIPDHLRGLLWQSSQITVKVTFKYFPMYIKKKKNSVNKMWFQQKVTLPETGVRCPIKMLYTRETRGACASASAPFLSRFRLARCRQRNTNRVLRDNYETAGKADNSFRRAF